MFIKLTRFDNRPVWLNAAFIVTVEPRREGSGAVVVPIGDGLDYDVRESPEDVLRLLDGAPAPAVVPVPVSDGLAPTPADVSPEPEKPVPEDVKPKKRAPRARKTPAKASAKESAKPAPEVTAPVLPLEAISEKDVERLRKLAPKSLVKLQNTLTTQFHVADLKAGVAYLVQKDVFKLDGNRVVWPAL